MQTRMQKLFVVFSFGKQFLFIPFLLNSQQNLHSQKLINCSENIAIEINQYIRLFFGVFSLHLGELINGQKV